MLFSLAARMSPRAVLLSTTASSNRLFSSGLRSISSNSTRRQSEVNEINRGDRYDIPPGAAAANVLKPFTKSTSARDPLRHILDHEAASIFLRDACKCAKCIDQGTTQREFNIANIPVDLKPSSSRQDKNGNWVIEWQNDMSGWEDHVSVFTPTQIEKLRAGVQPAHRTSTRLWDGKSFSKDRFNVTYEDYLHDEGAMAQVLHAFAEYGLVFINEVPKNEKSVELLATRIAAMKSTFYDSLWDIRSVPDAKNVAFTSKYLGFHSDLVYLKEPPTVQYLHCLENSSDGGESRFVDQFKALDLLFSEDRELGNALAGTRLRYQYDNDGFYYTDIKPIVQYRDSSHSFPYRQVRGAVNREIHDVYRMYWGPQFLGSIVSEFGLQKSDVELSLRAMHKYAGILERDEMVYQEKMTPGTCVMFDNLRILHARNEFDINSGKRWLRGTYLEAQDLWSKEIALSEQMSRLDAEKAKLRGT